jgi:hypothetical protein
VRFYIKEKTIFYYKKLYSISCAVKVDWKISMVHLMKKPLARFAAKLWKE